MLQRSSYTSADAALTVSMKNKNIRSTFANVVIVWYCEQTAANLHSRQFDETQQLYQNIG